MRARLGESTPDALDVADSETTADERIQSGSARDDVPSRLRPRELELVEHLGFDERELVPAPGTAEGASTGRVAIPLESTPGDGDSRLDLHERLLGCGRDEQSRDDSATDLGPIRPLAPEGWIQRRHEPALFDAAAGCHGGRRVEQRSGRRSEHHDSVVPSTYTHAREPAARPRERRGIGDRDQPEIVLGEPLPEEQERVGLRVGRRLAQDLSQAQPQLGLETFHGPRS